MVRAVTRGHMLLTLVFGLIIAGVLGKVLHVRAARDPHSRHLGRMSDQWLTQHRGTRRW